MSVLYQGNTLTPTLTLAIVSLVDFLTAHKIIPLRHGSLLTFKIKEIKKQIRKIENSQILNQASPSEVSTQVDKLFLYCKIIFTLK